MLPFIAYPFSLIWVNKCWENVPEYDCVSNYTNIVWLSVLDRLLLYLWGEARFSRYASHYIRFAFTFIIDFTFLFCRFCSCGSVGAISSKKRIIVNNSNMLVLQIEFMVISSLAYFRLFLETQALDFCHDNLEQNQNNLLVFIRLFRSNAVVSAKRLEEWIEFKVNIGDRMMTFTIAKRLQRIL